MTGNELDQQDVLANYKQEFFVEKDTVYMDGNSLGLLSKRAEAKLHSLIDSWKTFGIDGWTEGEHPWFTLAENMSARIAPLVGAKAHEVMVTGSITSNIHQMLSTLFQPTPDRFAILVDDLNFPSDIYAVESHLRLRGLDPAKAMKKVGSRDGYTLKLEDIIEQLTDDVAVLLLPSVLYRSGQLLQIREITEAAHKKGILVGFDLAHSIGAMPHQLHDDGVDFAVWCHYKYMNSGPGGQADYIFMNVIIIYCQGMQDGLVLIKHVNLIWIMNFPKHKVQVLIKLAPLIFSVWLLYLAVWSCLKKQGFKQSAKSHFS
ncbi:Kynureninase [Planococcus halocryophilus Or1]|nr:Kynureninase [Planococcus halocryophilus Or1]